MKRCYVLIFLFLQFVIPGAMSQESKYVVKLSPFSSAINDEFSPVFYKGDLVFCSNLRSNSLAGFQQNQERLFKIVYAARSDSLHWKHAELFSKELTSEYNDGPVSFDPTDHVIYFSRNNNISREWKNIDDTTNKLGIYFAECIDGKWTHIQSFPCNNPFYNFTTPSVSPNGKRIYFASDMPGGFGGYDLYYCEKQNNTWGEPVNLGPAINSHGNEAFPFAGAYGKLFFASDGLGGYGGKDLYYTQEINGIWINPVHMDSTINSAADDFGIVTDSTFEAGYFSSNRKGTDDIYSFRKAPEQFGLCDTVKETNYCFTFYDERYQLVDTLQLLYQWDFGDGIKHPGEEVKHCFPGPGRYTVTLSITDMVTGKPVVSNVIYPVELEESDQGYIRSPLAGLVNKPIQFDALLSGLKPADITDYFWDFGTGFTQGGTMMGMTFRKPGEYTVKLGWLSAADKSGKSLKSCIMKNIRIYDKFTDLTPESIQPSGNRYGDSADSCHAVEVKILCMHDLTDKQAGKLRQSLNIPGGIRVGFTRDDLDPKSYAFLDQVADVMKLSPDIQLEIRLHMDDPRIKMQSNDPSEYFAREISFYLKNKGVAPSRLSASGVDNRGLFPVKNADNQELPNELVEFIFMKM
jgi:outer membrane protein OmpA-like peptidoglycan-associated protein